MRRPTIGLLIASIIQLTADAWAAPQKGKDWAKEAGEVAGQPYETNVDAIRDEFAEAFPLMALIEVRIIEVLLDSSADLGLFYSLVTNQPDREGEIGFLKESEVDLRSLSTGDPGLRMLGVLAETAEARINAAIEALASQRQVTIWAEPSVLTLMDHSAAIQSGDDVPYIKRVVVGNTETLSSKFQPTGVSLWVLPKVVERDLNQLINLELYANVSTVTRFRQEEGYQQPIVDTRRYEGVVEVHPREYIVLGTIYRSVVSDTRRGVPILMDVPLIGWAARTTTERSSQSELWILVRPHIVDLEQPGKLDLETLWRSPDRRRPLLPGSDGKGLDLTRESE